jgi:CheY-like chemotaxis protein
MPPYNGDEAVKEIRAIEALHKINNNEEIPIIAISGQGEKEDIYNLLKCQITDYFIKGSKPELLLRVIANYIN